MDAADIYDAYWLSGTHKGNEWTEDFFEESLGVLAGKKCVLDYGCGMGYSYQRHLVSTVEQYIGADISNQAISEAKKKGLNAVQIKDDGTTGIEEASCDGAVCSEVFEHLWDPLATAKELHRVLKPGGTLVATVPNFGYFPWRFRAFLTAYTPSEPEPGANKYKGVHIRFFNKKLLDSLLRDAGFSEVKIYGWCGCSIWHIFWAAGPISAVTPWLEKNLPAFLQLNFLARWFPSVFAQRLRAVAKK